MIKSLKVSSYKVSSYTLRQYSLGYIDEGYKKLIREKYVLALVVPLILHTVHSLPLTLSLPGW